ncbi:hypothetical protein [Cytobacillus purgationiresistens]|nr:hypothetical protein [Cytobacillus purgationiresistens]
MICLIESAQTSGNYVIDARVGLPNGHLNSSALGAGWSSFFINGVNSTVYSSISYTNIPKDQKVTLRFGANTFTDDVYFLSSYLPHARSKGRLYKITYYNAGKIVALFDFNTKSAIDQSGKGNHATLVGGTWLDDGTGGGELVGDDGMLTVDTRQILFADSFTQAETKQNSYLDGAISASTSQINYEDSTYAFDTLQQLYNEGQIGSVPFDSLIITYANGATTYVTVQAIVDDAALPFDLSQRFFVIGERKSDFNVMIYKDALTVVDTLQRMIAEWSEYQETIKLTVEISQRRVETLEVVRRKTIDIKL